MDSNERVEIAAVFLVAIIMTGVFAFYLGGVQEWERATSAASSGQPMFSDVHITATTTSTYTVFTWTTATIGASPITNQPFAVFIDNTPQLRIAWDVVPFAVNYWALYDNGGNKLIEFNELTGAPAMNAPDLAGLPVGFGALSHQIHVGDLVTIVVRGSLNGSPQSEFWAGQITTCNPMLTWC